MDWINVVDLLPVWFHTSLVLFWS